MALKVLTIRLESEKIDKLKNEANLKNMIPAEYYRWKLMQDIPEDTSNESLNEKILQLDYNIVGCQRLIAALIMTIYSSNPNIKGKVNNLTTAQIENIAYADAELEDLLMDYIESNKKG